MHASDFRKLINLMEARNPELDYVDEPTKTTVNLKSYKSQVYTKLSQKVNRIAELESEIKQLKEEVKQSTREDIADLFDAEDAVRTRVVDTISFIMTLSKDPAATNTPKYKDILEALTNHLTPELITVLEGLKKEMVTVTQKAPSLKIQPKTVDEGKTSSFFARIKNWVLNWGKKYDKTLNALKAQARVA